MEKTIPLTWMTRYDFWYQPYHNVMISTEWGHPRSFFKGLDMADVAAVRINIHISTSYSRCQGNYGTHLNVYDWTTRELKQKIDLGMEGVMPLEIRFLHDPKATVGFVGSALFSNMFRIFKTEKVRTRTLAPIIHCRETGRQRR